MQNDRISGMLEELRKIRKEYLEIQEKYQSLNDKFEKEIKANLKSIEKYFSNKWNPLKIKTLHITGNNDDNFNPYIIYWFQLDKEIYFDEEWGWYFSTEYDATIYNSNKFEFPENLDISLLENTLSRVLPARPYLKKIRKNKPEIIHNLNDIKLCFENINLLEEGKIWHVGWDISDHFFIIEDSNKKIRIFYSTNGHGFGCDHELPKHENLQENLKDLNEFFTFLTNKELGHIQDKWEKIITENWNK